MTTIEILRAAEREAHAAWITELGRGAGGGSVHAHLAYAALQRARAATRKAEGKAQA